MIENVKRYRAHTSHGRDVGKTVCVLYAVSALLMLIPYVKYVVWLAPLMLLLWEKESDFAIFMYAQLFSLAAVYGAATLLIEGPIGYMVRWMDHSLSFGWVLAGDLTGFLFSLLLAFVTLASVILTLMAASRAYKYIEAHIILAGSMADRIKERPRFRD